MSDTFNDPLEQRIKERIRTIRGWPAPHVNFRDVTTLFDDPDVFGDAIDTLAKAALENGITRIAAIDARGFILGAALASQTRLPLTLVRKAGKLPPPCRSESYELEYGKASVEIRTDACSDNDTIMLVDDLIATGGTLRAAARLLKGLGARIALVAAIIDLPELGGSRLLSDDGMRVLALCRFSETE